MISPEPYLALREGAALVDRSGRGRIRLTGNDRRAYLQGLLTNDIAGLAPGEGCYACLLTAQGRMISDMYVVETGDAILMDLEPHATTRVVAHLDQFVFSEDVVVVDVTESTRQLAVFGPRSTQVLRDSLGASVDGIDLEGLPVLSNRAIAWNGQPVTIVRRDDLGEIGFDLWIAADLGDALSPAIRDAGAAVAGPEVAEIRRVEAGRPAFGKDMTEETIPLEAGIEDRAISRTKGCYVGQEVIIRVLDRGHGRVARRLVGLTCEVGADVPGVGAPISVGDRAIGSITSAVLSPSLERPIALGYVHRDFVATGTGVTIGAGVPATVTALPFVSAESSVLRPQH
jgi:folate-binding protein YgfZ